MFVTSITKIQDTKTKQKYKLKISNLKYYFLIIDCWNLFGNCFLQFVTFNEVDYGTIYYQKN